MSVLLIRPKNFDSSYPELRLSELTFVNLYKLLVLVMVRANEGCKTVALVVVAPAETLQNTKSNEKENLWT